MLNLMNDPPAVCELYPSHCWKWRCPTCGKATSVITENCFLKGLRKYVIVMNEMYLWATGQPPIFISEQVPCGKNQVTQLNVYWREVLTLCNDESPKINSNCFVGNYMNTVIIAKYDK